jgi:hypothetical protein
MPKWEFQKWPPNKQWYKDNKAREVIIYCGSSDFTTNDGLSWSHPEGGQNIEIQGRKVGKKWTLCEEDEEAVTMENLTGSFDIMLLCGGIDKRYRGEANLADRGTFERLHNKPTKRGKKHELDYGMPFDYRIRRVLSFTLLHEMLHVARNDYSQYCLS